VFKPSCLRSGASTAPRFRQLICDIVKRGLKRAGLKPPRKGAHTLRHALACTMLRHGASLAEIGQVLRHRSPDTTAIYAKVDLISLRALAPEWPQATGDA